MIVNFYNIWITTEYTEYEDWEGHRDFYWELENPQLEEHQLAVL